MLVQAIVLQTGVEALNYSVLHLLAPTNLTRFGLAFIPTRKPGDLLP